MDHGDGSAAGQDADGDQRGIGIVKEEAGQLSELHIEKVAGRMRLIDARIKTIQGEREVDRIDVVQKAAAEGPSSERRGGHEKG